MKKCIVSIGNMGELKSSEFMEEKEADILVKDLNALYGAKTHIVVNEQQLRNMKSGLLAKPTKILSNKLGISKTKIKTRWDY